LQRITPDAIKPIIIALALALTTASVRAHTNLIDFETLPRGELPTEGMSISNQFAVSHGVSFAFTNGTVPLIAKRRGTNVIAFLGPNGDNTFDANQGVGYYFLTDPDAEIGLPPPPLANCLQPSSVSNKPNTKTNTSSLKSLLTNCPVDGKAYTPSTRRYRKPFGGSSATIPRAA
jgi:hypothetical protein